MALTREIEKARRQTATRANRERQKQAELRLTEIIKTAGIADGYEVIDTADDAAMERHFGRLFHEATTERMQKLVVDAFVDWQRFDRKMDALVRGQTDEAVSLLKRDNFVFLDGNPVPDEWLNDGCGPTGRAA